MTPIEQARATVASRFTGGPPTPHNPSPRSITGDAILRGDWDSGKLVQDELAKVQLRRTINQHASR